MIDVARVGLIVKREWWSRLRQRSFQITTLVQVLFVVAAGCLPLIVVALAGDDGPGEVTVLVIDDTGGGISERLAPYVVAVPEAGDDPADAETIALEPVTITNDEARTRVDDGDADGVLLANRDGDGNLTFTFINDTGSTTGTAQRLYAAAAAVSLEDRLARNGIDQAAFQVATAPPAFAIEGADGAAGGGDEISGVEIALAYFFTIVMFMAIMLYGTWVAQGVVEEKSSRIMEIMVNAATPRDLLAGKVIGIGLAGLTQLTPMLLAGGLVFGLQRQLAKAFNVDASQLPDVSFGEVSMSAIGWFLVYFLFGFTLYAALYAGLGSLVSRQEEVNQAVSPMMTVMMAGYFAAFFTMWAPESLFSRAVSIFPLTAPFVMVSRVITGSPPAWELALSVGLLAAATVLAILFAAHIYRMGVLQYGQKPSWKAVLSRNLTPTSR